MVVVGGFLVDGCVRLCLVVVDGLWLVGGGSWWLIVVVASSG